MNHHGYGVYLPSRHVRPHQNQSPGPWDYIRSFFTVFVGIIYTIDITRAYSFIIGRGMSSIYR